MKVTTNKKHTITLDAVELQERLINHFIGIIQDFSDSPVDLKTNVQMFNDALENILANRWAKLFSDGYTMMLLDDESMKYVEDFFIDKEKKKIHNDELELIVQKGTIGYPVKEDDIDY